MRSWFSLKEPKGPFLALLVVAISLGLGWFLQLLGV